MTLTEYKEDILSFVHKTADHAFKYGTTCLDGVYVAYLDKDEFTIQFSEKFTDMMNKLSKEEFIGALRTIRDLSELTDIICAVVYVKTNLLISVNSKEMTVCVIDFDGRGSRLRYMVGDNGAIIDIHEMTDISFNILTDTIF